MVSSVTRLLRFLEREALSCHLIALAFALNVWAWVIPRGDYRHPVKDVTGVQNWISGQFSDIVSLHYFWNGLLALTALSVGYLAGKLAFALVNALRDRVDL